MSFTFEWDDEKAASNLKKHGVPFEEALAIFLDPHRIERYDDREAYGVTLPLNSVSHTRDHKLACLD